MQEGRNGNGEVSGDGLAPYRAKYPRSAFKSRGIVKIETRFIELLHVVALILGSLC